METDADFMYRIVNDPANDVPRLMYADWLDERKPDSDEMQVRRQIKWWERKWGDPCPSVFAEFIRIQCELARINCVCSPEGLLQDLTTTDELGRFGQPYMCRACGKNLLWNKQRELWLYTFRNHDPGVPHGMPLMDWSMPGIIRYPERRVSASFRRGFLFMFRCPVDIWRIQGVSLMEKYPIQEVELVEGSRLDFVRVNHKWRMELGQLNQIPIMSRFVSKEYDSREEMIEAMLDFIGSSGLIWRQQAERAGRRMALRQERRVLGLSELSDEQLDAELTEGYSTLRTPGTRLS